jgi:hypothetical protein
MVEILAMQEQLPVSCVHRLIWGWGVGTNFALRALPPWMAEILAMQEQLAVPCAREVRIFWTSAGANFI